MNWATIEKGTIRPLLKDKNSACLPAGVRPVRRSPAEEGGRTQAGVPLHRVRPWLLHPSDPCHEAVSLAREGHGDSGQPIRTLTFCFQLLLYYFINSSWRKNVMKSQ